MCVLIAARFVGVFPEAKATDAEVEQAGVEEAAQEAPDPELNEIGVGDEKKEEVEATAERG